MEGGEILEMFMRSVGEHMSANGKAIVSINGKAALTVAIDRTTGISIHAPRAGGDC